MSNELVLVTGGSGFIAAHCIVELLRAGYAVRTTVRATERQTEVRELIRRGGAAPGKDLSFAVADLTKDAGWPEAVAGCAYVLHVASPFVAGAVKDENELIVPARDGTLRVLRAAREAGVKRVVVTSSFAAIGYGHPEREAPYDETSWTNVEGKGVTAYAKSKTLAERAAWDFLAKEGGQLELSTVNPVAVFGPALGPDLSPSILIVQRMLDGALPGFPKLSFGAVDVRDVAWLHLAAMTHPAAKGERFLACAGDCVSLREVALVLKQRLGPLSKRVPSLQLPNWVVRLAAMRDETIRQIVPELGRIRHLNNEKARRVLGWAPRSSEESIVATAESLAGLGLLKDSPKHG